MAKNKTHIQGTRNVGKMGERRFEEWTAQEGIVTNRVGEDEAGWDFIIEFPSESGAAYTGTTPLDLMEGSLRCMVQVKSTDQRPNSWGIKLDNWERFVKNPLPCFFLFLEYDHTNECKRAFLVHAWEEHIHRVLKKLRELSSQQDVELHKIKLSVAYRNAPQLTSLDGRGLVEAIRACVQTSPEEYARQKDALITNVGYEDGNRLINVSILPPDAEESDIREYLIDFTLGLVPYLEVTHGEIRDIRFGIPGPQPLVVFESGGRIIAEPQSLAESVIRLRTPDSREELRLPMATYVPQGITIDLTSPLFRFRLGVPHLDFILTPSKADGCAVEYDIPSSNEAIPLSEIKSLCQFISFMDRTKDHPFITMDITTNELPLASGQIRVNSLHEDIVAYATSVTSAWKALRAFDISSDINIRVSQVLRQHGAMMLVGDSINGDPFYLRIDFTQNSHTVDNADLKIDIHQLYCVPIVKAVFINDYRIVVSLVAIGRIQHVIDQSKSDDVIARMVTTDIRLRRKYINNRHEAFPLSVEALIDDAIEPFKDTMPIIHIQDY